MAVNETVPVVSVLMPVYNNEKHLEEAVESILGQTFRDFEFIIIDDGSRDRSLEILRAFEARDPRIRLFSRPNTGYCQALNEGLSYLRGEFMARMDADDIAMPDRLERQVAYLRAHGDCVALGGRVLLIDDEGDPLYQMCRQVSHEDIDGAHLAGEGGTLAHPALMARRQAVEAMGGYPTECPYAEDLDFLLRLAERGKLANLAETVLHYRQHLASISYTRTERQRRSAVKAVREARRRRGLDQEGEVELPVEAVPTAAAVHRKWAWWALGSGYARSARKHALRALLREPFHPDSWRAFACALRGH